jgi:hypothetical protein
MARPRKTSEELKKSGARAGRIAERIAEENIVLGIKAVEKQKELAKRGLLLETFIAQVKQERDTFFERLVPGQTVCKEYGAEFNWREGHPLTTIRTYAERISNGEIVSGDLTRGACRPARMSYSLRSSDTRASDCHRAQTQSMKRL